MLIDIIITKLWKNNVILKLQISCISNSSDNLAYVPFERLILLFLFVQFVLILS